MIGAYHGTADYPAAEILAVNPLRRRRKPLRGFRGVTARARPRKEPPCLKAYPCDTEDRELLSWAD